MEKRLSDCIEEVLQDKSIEALYIYGSYVNGYYRKDSDIDVVALTQTNSKDKPVSMPPNISVHLIHPITLEFFELGIPYTHLKMVPVYNERKVLEISDRMKSELVRRELIRFRRAGVERFNVLDPVNNFLLGYGVQRPWRIKPIKRIFESEESREILSEEYGRILGLLEQKRMVEEYEGHYRLNPNFVFDMQVEHSHDDLLFKLKNSYLGWHYVRNAISMIDFARRRK